MIWSKIKSAYVYSCIYVCTFVTFLYLLTVHRVRLSDGPNPRAGRVEVYTNSTGGLDNGEWGTVCDDYYWDIWAARVVCRQLGYPDAVATPLFAHYGEGTGSIWLDDVFCYGHESDLFACMHNGIGVHDCTHYEDASAECSGIMAMLLTIKIIQLIGSLVPKAMYVHE